MDLSGRSKYLIDVENHYELAIASANRSHEFGPPACSNARYVGRYYFVELGDLVDLVGKDSNRCRLAFEIDFQHHGPRVQGMFDSSDTQTQEQVGRMRDTAV